MSDQNEQPQAPRPSDRMEAIRRKQAEDMQKRQVLKSILDDAGYERMSNIRIANSAMYDRLIQVLIQLAQSGRVSGKISDAQLKTLLDRVQSQRHEPNITFKRK
ncbi:hypothetical protein HY994_06590 [Candidatus Micrarchaeota archaeon]|nr:hypothetical protein [Candidatus Micrarchaeota archaeon]